VMTPASLTLAALSALAGAVAAAALIVRGRGAEREVGRRRGKR
jgi:hypothetical protein